MRAMRPVVSEVQPQARWPGGHSLLVAVGLTVAWVAYTSLGALVLGAVLPDLPGYSTTGPSQSLLLVRGGAVLLAPLVADARLPSPDALAADASLRRSSPIGCRTRPRLFLPGLCRGSGERHQRPPPTNSRRPNR